MKSDNSNRCGMFLVVEGIDGAGTTTQASLLAEWIRGRGRSCRLTGEPSRGPLGRVLRQILSNQTDPICNDSVALLFAADRMDHLEKEILPALLSGDDLVSDRYYHSSLTYQSLQGDQEWIRALNQRARIPDVTYILDLPAEQAEARRLRSRTSVELYEELSIQQRLEGAYRLLPSLLDQETIVILDGREEIANVHGAMVADLQMRFPTLYGR